MTAVTTDSEPRATPAADVATTVRLLRGVERLPEGANGALVFGNETGRWGTLLVEDKRVCWAAATGMETRLTDILRQQTDPPIAQETIEDVFEQCRKDGMPLGTALVSRGVVTPSGLERALRQHTGEAVRKLSHVLGGHRRISPTWIPNRTRRYDAQFTFTPAEILVCVGSLGNEDVTPRAHRVLEPVKGDSVVAAAFFANDEEREVLPVAQVQGETLGVEGLVRLCTWARNTLRRSSSFAPGRRFVAAMDDERRTAVAWNSREVLCAALCQDRTAVSVLLARRARAQERDFGNAS